MKTLVIVGNGRTRTSAPHDDLSREIWTMNNHAMLWNRRTTAVFEMHSDALTANRYGEDYKDWLRQVHPFPIFMHEPQTEIPSSVRYPREEINAVFGKHLYKGKQLIQDFFTSTFPYTLALALHYGFKCVELYGVDLDKEERQSHRDSVFFWIGKATACDVDIFIPEKCVLYDETLYPF